MSFHSTHEMRISQLERRLRIVEERLGIQPSPFDFASPYWECPYCQQKVYHESCQKCGAPFKEGYKVVRPVSEWIH